MEERTSVTYRRALNYTSRLILINNGRLVSPREFRSFSIEYRFLSSARERLINRGKREENIQFGK